MANANSPNGSFQAKEWLENLRLYGGPSLGPDDSEYTWSSDRQWAKWFGQTSLQGQCDDLLKLSEIMSLQELVTQNIEGIAEESGNTDSLRLLQRKNHTDYRDDLESLQTIDPVFAEVTVRRCKELHKQGVISALGFYHMEACKPAKHGAVGELPSLFNFTQLYVQSFWYQCSRNDDVLVRAIESLVCACQAYSKFLQGVEDNIGEALRLCNLLIRALENRSDPGDELFGEVESVNKRFAHHFQHLLATTTTLEQESAALSLAGIDQLTFKDWEVGLCALFPPPDSPLRMTLFYALRLEVLVRFPRNSSGVQMGMQGFFTCYLWFENHKNAFDVEIRERTERAVFTGGALNGVDCCLAVLTARLEQYGDINRILQQDYLDLSDWRTVHMFYSRLDEVAKSSLPLVKQWMGEWR